jgi:hypothetical protein
MSRLLIFMALGFVFSCASSIPPMPGYGTDGEKACGRDCQTQYSACMKNEVRPDFLLMSPRKEACQKMLRECYDTCSSKEKGN